MELPRMNEALEILKQISLEFDIDMPSLRDPSRISHFVAARKEFYIRSRARGICIGTIAHAVGRDHSTVSYHAGEDLEERRQRFMAMKTVIRERKARIASREHLDAQHRKEVVQRFLNGERLRDIADLYSIHIDTVSRIAKRAGAPPRPGGRPRLKTSNTEALT